MNINGIDIPERILTAQQQNKLVIFAGAGISIDPPSNLPGFDQLAEKIGTLTLCNRKEEEPIDTYLGRVQHEGKNIYEIINTILSDPNSKNNDYHSSLLKLFPQDQIHLVTTNQDAHFTTVAKKIIKHDIHDIKIYYAPALPLAKSFTGIVYLHGNLEDDLENMVFTDSDFGEAYLVEGWASRFLKDLFSNYVILFIGYSYDDPVMKYFSRGMQYNDNRFIFTCRDDNTEDYWQRLHITPIYYNKENNHCQLLDCIVKWGKMYSLQYTDQKERLNTILSNKTTLNTDDKDYLFYIINKDYGAKFFCDLADDYYWFDFLLNEGKLEFIFNEEQLTNGEMFLIIWVIEHFILSNIEELLVILARKGSHINPYFAYRALQFLFTTRKEEKNQSESKLTEYHHQLLLLILHQNYVIEDKFYIELLLLELEIPKDISNVLLLFNYLIKPTIKLDKSFRIINTDEYRDTTHLKFILSGDLYNIKKAWEEILRPNMHLIAYDIFLSTTEYIKKIYLMLDKDNKERYDSFSFMRSSIESHEQDQNAEDIYFLIDVLRESIDYYILNDITMCDYIISSWSNSNVLILERLSIYSMQNAQHINSNKKVNWLIDKKWLYKFGAKKEIFDLIRFTYDDLTPKIKSKLIMEILNLNMNDDTELKEYQVYNFLVFLNTSYPNDSKIMSELKKVMKRNPTFKPREHPEFDSYFYIGNYEGGRSPKSKKEMLSEDPPSLVEWLLEYKDKDITEFKWSELLRELAEAASDDKPNYEWTGEIICELEKRKALHSDIFASILQGIEKDPITSGLLKKLLKIIIKNYDGFDCKKLISYLILGQTRENKEAIKLISVNTYFKGLQYIYSYHKNKGITIDGEIDSIATNLMMSTFRVFTIIMEEDKKLDSVLANTLFNFIADIAFDTSEFSLYAKPTIAIQYVFINYHRPDLADKMIELFDMDQNTECAKAIWKGFLGRGNYNDGVVKKLFNNFKKLFRTISEEEDELIKAFCLKAVDIAFNFEIEETRDRKWIKEMIGSVSEKVREEFANVIKRELFRLDRKKADQLWNDWIREYWDMRNKNIPVKLTQNEINEMMFWVIHFDINFDESVEYITKNSVPFNAHILLDLENEDRALINKHPNSVAKYFYHLLKECSPDLSMYDKHCISEFSRKIFQHKFEVQIKGKIEQELTRLGINL